MIEERILSLRKMPRMDLDVFDTFLQTLLFLKISSEFLIADALHRLIVKSDPLIQQSFDLLYKTLFHHPVDSFIDPFEQYLSRCRQTDDQTVVDGPMFLLSLDLRDPLVMLLIDVECPDQTPAVVDMDLLQRFRIFFFQQFVQFFVAEILILIIFPIFLKELIVIETGLDIKTRSSDDDRQFSFTADLIDVFPGKLLKLLDAVAAVCFLDVDQIMLRLA